MHFADKDDVVSGLIFRIYNIFVVNSEQGLCNFGVFEYRCCFCAHWPSEFSDSNLNQRPNSSERVSTSSFSRFVHFGTVLQRVHNKFEVVFPIYGLWLTIFWTFSKDFTHILNVYDAQIPHNDVASRTIIEWRNVARTIRSLALRSSMLKSAIHVYKLALTYLWCKILPRLMASKPLLSKKSGRKVLFSLSFPRIVTGLKSMCRPKSSIISCM